MGREPGKLIKKTWPLSQICETCNISHSKWERTILFVFWANMICSLNTISLRVSSKCPHFLSVCLIKKVSLLAVLQGERSSNWPDYLKCSFSGLNLSYPRSHRKGTDANLHSPSGLGKWFLHCERSGISIRLDEQSLWKMHLSHISCLLLCSPNSSYLE